MTVVIAAFAISAWHSALRAKTEASWRPLMSFARRYATSIVGVSLLWTELPGSSSGFRLYYNDEDGKGEVSVTAMPIH